MRLRASCNGRRPTRLYLRTIAPVLATWAASVPVLAQVTIDGGLDRAQSRYVWTVTNGESKPIVGVQLPHFHAQSLTTPEGWEHEITNKAETGRTGTVTAKRTLSQAEISPGRSAVFTLTFAAQNCAPGKGTVTITFADGTTATVSGVEIPSRTQWFQRFTLLIGLGGMFAIYAIVQAIRGRRAKADSAHGAD